jgi:hypothetical protein
MNNRKKTMSAANSPKVHSIANESFFVRWKKERKVEKKCKTFLVNFTSTNQIPC